MIEHIVRMNEGVDNILNIYQISLDELKDNNLHITDFNNLRCGMKLLIPYFSKNIEQVLESTEGFVQKYYPKVSEVLEEAKKEEIVQEAKKEEIVQEVKKEAVQVPKEVKMPDNLRRYVGTIPPKKPYNGHKKI